MTNCWFVPDVRFVCRDFHLGVMRCVQGWGIVGGGVELTGWRIYSSWPCCFLRSLDSYQTNQHKHIWTNLQYTPGDTLQNHKEPCLLKSKNNDFIVQWEAFLSLANIDSGGEEAGHIAAQFPLNYLCLPFFLFSLSRFPPFVLLNQNLEIIYEVRMGFLSSRSGYLSRAQWGGTPVWRPTPPIKGIASEWIWRSHCWIQLWFDVWL